MDDLFYLASPYSSPDDAIEQKRYRDVVEATAYFLSQGVLIYSPIVHNHEPRYVADLPGHVDFWWKLDKRMIQACNGLWVLALEGWDESVGIQKEVEFALSSMMPVEYKEWPVSTL